MAGGAIVNTAGGKDYPGKLTLFVFLTCVVAATGGLIFGYDIGISGTWRDVDEPVPAEVLPGGVPEEAGGEQEQPVLQVRQPAAPDLHLLALPRRPRRLLLRRHRHPRPRPQVVHVRRRPHLPRRRSAQRRRRERRHAHRRTHPPRHRRRLRQSVCAGVPVGDGAGAPPRHAQHRFPAHDHDRHPCGGAHQLRHEQDQGRVGLAREPCARGGAGGDHHAGRAVPPRHAQLPDRPRAPGGGAEHAPAHPRDGRHRRGVRGPGGGERGVEAGAAPVAQHPEAQVPRAANHGHLHPLLPAAHRHQRHHVLRARALRHPRLQERRLPHVRRHHRPRQRLRHPRLRLHRRQARPPQALPPGRHADDRVPDRGGDAARHQVRDERDRRDLQGLRGGGGALHLRLRRRIRLVVGTAGVAGAQRDLPAGDPAGGAEHQRLRQHALHLRHRAGLPHHALPHEVRPLLLLRRLGRHHDHLHRALPPGDQERAHRGDGARLEGALVLGPIHRRLRRPRRRQPRRPPDGLQRQAGRLLRRLDLD